MKLNMTKTMGAGAIALVLAVSGGTMAFAANSQRNEIPNTDIIADAETERVYKTAFDYENDSRIVKDEANVAADSGARLLPTGDNIVSE